MKKQARDHLDFIRTISDDDVIDLEEEEEEEEEEEKQEKETKASKKNKPAASAKTTTASKTTTAAVMNPDFCFAAAGVPTVDGAEHPWDFASAKVDIKSKQNGPSYTTLDQKIERRRKEIAEKGKAEKSKKNDEEAEDEEEADAMIQDDGDDDDEEEDGFGMGAENENVDDAEEDPLMDSEDEASESEEEAESEEEHSEDEERATDDDFDEEEEKRKRDYFATDDNEQNDIPETFQTMNLSRPILRGLAEVGFVKPTAIQARTIPVALLGRDICGGAVTGSGKTAAFIVPILERLLYRPKAMASTRVLILAPTRELAIQCHSVAERLAQFTDIQFCLAVGGLSLKAQELKLKQRPDVIIATPGRLIDHLRNSMSVHLDSIEILVMDEADRMLEDGFAAELKEITSSCPTTRQTMLFSATMTDNVDELIRLSMDKPVRLFVDLKNTTAARLTQEFVRVRAHREADRPALLLALCKRTFKSKVIIFCKSKAGAHQMKIVFGLFGLKAAELHGNLSQEQRLEAIELFRDGRVDYLLATDLASRGLDIKGIETVINFNMPQQFAQYLHRVGRTARAGRGGRSVTLAGEADRKILKMAIKHAPKGTVKNRVVKPEIVEKYRKLVEKFEEEVRAVMAEEHEEKMIRQAEMEVRKASNIIEHEAEISSRPARTWFQSNAERQEQKEIGAKQHGSAFTEEEGDGVVFASKKRKAAMEEAAAEKKAAIKRHPLAGLSRAKKRKMEMNRAAAEFDTPARQAIIRGSVKAAKKSTRAVKMSQFGDGEQLKPTAGQAAQTKRLEEKAKKKRREAKKTGGKDGFSYDLTDSTRFGAGPKHDRTSKASSSSAGAKKGGGKVANKNANKASKSANKANKSRGKK